MSKEQVVAREILKYIGGKENIKSMEHCATRLRLIVEDKEKIDTKAIENIDGVKGQYFAAAQFQIILGTGFVNKVFAECRDIENFHKEKVLEKALLKAFQNEIINITVSKNK